MLRPLHRFMAGATNSWPEAAVNGSLPRLSDSADQIGKATPGDLLTRQPLTGIKALMLAVLDNGIESYLSPIARHRAEAECWISARSQGSPFSFAVVCETLG